MLEEVTDGDTVLVPHGWHGPSIASPSHHMYYLNVMAGPGAERAWGISDDPNHGWVRETWAEPAHRSAAAVLHAHPTDHRSNVHATGEQR